MCWYPVPVPHLDLASLHDQHRLHDCMISVMIAFTSLTASDSLPPLTTTYHYLVPVDENLLATTLLTTTYHSMVPVDEHLFTVCQVRVFEEDEDWARPRKVCAAPQNISLCEITARSWGDHSEIMGRSQRDHGEITARSWGDHNEIMGRSLRDHKETTGGSQKDLRRRL